MSTLGQHHYLSWLRTGIGNSIATQDTLGGPGGSGNNTRPSITVSIQTNGTENGPSKIPPVRFELYGPGDVAGIDGAVFTPWPNSRSSIVPYNYFPYVEISSPDLPWRYTPAAPNPNPPAPASGNFLRPWICLIVLRADEYTETKGTAKQPLSIIHVTNPSKSLPNLAQVSYWAHVQVSGDPPDGVPIEQYALSDQSNAIARLICPRELEPNTAYNAFVVPVFNTGRLAGLGSQIDNIDGMQNAWDATSNDPVDIPVYYQFHFTTDKGGDFEYLVSLLQPRVLDKSIGTRSIDATSPDPLFGTSSAGILGLGGALISTGAQPPAAWQEFPPTGMDQGKFTSDITTLVNTQTATVSGVNTRLPLVGPPLYGKWYTSASQVANGQPPYWLYELNTDPRNRIIAGFGTLVIQQNRSQLLASAWTQATGIESANQVLRQSQYSRMISAKMFQKYLLPAPVQEILYITAPVQKKILNGNSTMKYQLDNSILPRAALSPTFRRIVSPSSQIRKRQSFTQASTDMLDRLNNGKISAAPQPKTKDVVTINKISDKFLPSWAPAFTYSFLPYLFIVLWGIAALIYLISTTVLGISSLNPVLLAMVGALISAGAIFWKRHPDWKFASQFQEQNLTPVAILSVPPQPNFQITQGGNTPIPVRVSSPSTDNDQASRFRKAAIVLQSHLLVQHPQAAAPTHVTLDSLQKKLNSSLDPQITIPARIVSRFTLSSWFTSNPQDPLQPFIIGVDFPQPMYKYLVEISQELFLPGISKIPPNTVGLLKTNPQFIEAYHVGLNDEWNRVCQLNRLSHVPKYTSFLDFWPKKSFPLPKGQNITPDINPIYYWPTTNHLGDNGANATSDTSNLVLIIYGDLLRLYPTTIIFATKVSVDGNGNPAFSGDEHHPIFRCSLEPDITLVGFDLKKADVLAQPTDGNDKGWFFVFQEHPMEISFGLEIADISGSAQQSWNDLQWSDVVLTDSGYIDIVSSKPPQLETGTTWGQSPADQAHIFFRRPLQVAYNAQEMIPGE